MQLFIPARTSSVLDILANALGAGLGAILHDLVSKRFVITPNLMGRLRLETPLMGLIYLLIPLLWIDVIALNESPKRWILTCLLSISGRSYLVTCFAIGGSLSIFRVIGYACLAAGTWFVIGVGPTLLRPFPILIIACGVVLLTGMLTVLPSPAKERRFERSTLKILFPFFVLAQWELP